MSQVESVLDRAYRLIDEGQLSEAQSLLKALLPEHEKNPDVWWLLVHATDDPEEGQKALQKVLELDPESPQALELSQQIKVNAGANTKAQRRFPVRLLFVAILTLVILGILFLLLSRPSSNPEITATLVAQGVEVSATPDAVMIEASPTLEALIIEASPTSEALVIEASPTLEMLTLENLQTQLPALVLANVNQQDEVLLIGVCEQIGPSAANAITQVLETMSLRLSDTTMNRLEIAINDCSTNTELRVVSIPREALESFANRDIDLNQLIAQLRPVR